MTSHPNYERALAAIGERHPAHIVDHWRGLFRRFPEWLDLDTTCPKCEAAPFHPCTTPTDYLAKRTHRQRSAV